MNAEDLAKAESCLRGLRAALEALDSARKHLDLINKHIKGGESWTVKLCLSKGRDDYHDINFSMKLQASVVQQAAVDGVRRAQRAVVLSGGLA